MIGLDTNLLVGWLVEDSDTTLPASSSYFISVVVMAEFVWVMQTVFDNTKSELLHTLQIIVAHPAFSFDELIVIERAVADFEKGSADFSDYLLLHDCLAKGASHVATRDKKAARHKSFQMVK